ncbi:DEAD/DEAH box helicase [Aspergillus costaricaensis CBS 115574]|uniref:DEAD/DEAH box helicase n=1 Tax=Aspergillus costaricaensis CBS 115574 TaxID=1448317 RepID=A0ACD1I779_9EURO|nr:DEAD/DEAH box helicase [Aspergillus costaricaensis CBS 115574]RAK85618.1 DEAD/DEAH box helicase [Aspergillus costaricaensis CBS 115574]
MTNPQKLLSWYTGLYSRTVDLVGDYAGSELFIIEGDSLLLHCFADDQLDFSNGFQLLHATYIVERLLAQLRQRNCNFHIVFFADNSEASIPPHADELLLPKYRLAREAILQHLQQNVPKAFPSMQVRCFDTYNCSDFEKYLTSEGVYFIMCHDGAISSSSGHDRAFGRALEDPEKVLSEDSSDSGCDETFDSALSSFWTNRVTLRSMIHWFIAYGFNISLLNSLECRDTKVYTMVLEGSAERARNLFCVDSVSLDIAEDTVSSGSDTEEVESETNLVHCHGEASPSAQKPSPTSPPSVEPTLRNFSPILDATNHTLTQREWATVLTASVLLTSDYCEENEMLGLRVLLMHAIILSECKLENRVYDSKYCHLGELLLVKYVEVYRSIITSQLWHEAMRARPLTCDVADLIDGWLFLELIQLEIICPSDLECSFSQSIVDRFSVLASLVKGLCGVEIASFQVSDQTSGSKASSKKKTRKSGNGQINSRTKTTSVLPFNNPDFDRHLKPISLAIDESAAGKELAVSRIFEEISHWHNHRRPLDQRNAIPLTEWLLRRNQKFMAETEQYAASLTDAKPESIFVKTKTDPKVLSRKNPAPEATERDRTSQSTKNGPKQTRHPKTSVSASVKAKAEAHFKEQRASNLERQLKAWETKRHGIEHAYNLVRRYQDASEYLHSLKRKGDCLIELDILAYLIMTLAQLWKNKCETEKDKPMGIVALIWFLILRISKAKQGITVGIRRFVEETIKALNLPRIDIPCHSSRKATSSFTPISSQHANLQTGLSPVEFQLVHAGPYFDRNMESAPDPRVHDFDPDRWQREILDQIDAKASLFVVAPTSAGKTFISFYAMKQVLESSDDGVLVYVAPTKALVNQIAAEVQARFSKSYKYAGQSVWAIHTRDYRINNPTSCQILITVPHILQIMLLAPSNAGSWASRIQRIIFDEIHCIGQSEDGVVWEQLLLLAPCPIIALSATVGNPEEFSDWLKLTQNENGHELKMIEHKTRWSDLRKFQYRPPSSFIFNGLSNITHIAALGLDSCPNMSFIHPVTSLTNRSRGFPDDLTMEPRDCWTLWKAMDKYKTANYPLDKALDPSNALPGVISKANIVEWEAKLKLVLKHWMNNSDSPFDAVVEELAQGSYVEKNGNVQVSSGELGQSDEPRAVNNRLLSTTLPLICSLHNQGALPAIFFNYDRSECERMCQHILDELEQSEARWKVSSTSWANKIRKSRSEDRDENMSRAEQMRETASAESSWHALFDPDEPISRFSLADKKKLAGSEFEEHAQELHKRQVSPRLIDAMKRGIGVHHAGMNRKYRQVCEMLFRRGYLRVVIATGTLALGINMPCKTVVFAGDSVFLTALGFRQAAGRAGRRGFDFLGNVVFQCIPDSKIYRLLSSKLPSLNGHFPLSTTLVLRLFILLRESDGSEFAVKAIDSILSCPRIYLGGPEAKHTVLHHLRFSIEYLRRNQLLDASGCPLNFSGTISHLYYTENSSFAFHALLNGGYFHRLCKNIGKEPKETVLTLMLVMSHLFGRKYLPPVALENLRTSEKRSPSVVILPSLPKKAASILRSHNEKTQDIYTSYVTTFVEQHIIDPGCFLPLTGMKCGGDKSPEGISHALAVTPPTRVTSSFAALSGHGDKWRSISDLCKKVRSGVWLEQAVVPYVGLYPEEGKLPLNAYLYDFFKHGNVKALEKGNMIRKGDIWFLLNDFSLVLATIVTDFENYLKLSPNIDLDLLDVAGSGDVHEIDLDDNAYAANDPLPGTAAKSANLPQVRMQATTKPPLTSASANPKRAKVADSWEDELSDDEESENKVPEREGNAKATNNPTSSTLPSDIEQGFLQVLRAFRMLQAEFNEKFKAMWA